MNRATAVQRTPILHEGDHLTFDEFIARWENMNEFERRGKHPELINGKVYMNAAAISYSGHGQPQRMILGLFEHFVAETPGVEWAAPVTAKLDDESGPEPDAELFILPEFGGNVQINNGFLTGTPDLVIEIAASSVSKDMFEKRDMYEQAGIPEYLVWRTEDRAFDYFRLEKQQYVHRTLDPEEKWFSRTFPTLVFDIHFLLAIDYRAALKTLRQSLASPAHAVFVAELQDRKSK
ncbi:Uma2 family endonuclease [Lacunimicrobium album]